MSDPKRLRAPSGVPTERLRDGGRRRQPKGDAERITYDFTTIFIPLFLSPFLLSFQMLVMLK